MVREHSQKRFIIPPPVSHVIFINDVTEREKPYADFYTNNARKQKLPFMNRDTFDRMTDWYEVGFLGNPNRRKMPHLGFYNGYKDRPPLRGAAGSLCEGDRRKVNGFFPKRSTVCRGFEAGFRDRKLERQRVGKRF